MPAVGAIIIGNEILSGKFADENTPWLIGRCRSLGLDLVRISVIPDVVDGIAEEVARCSAALDFVFTTGGVGPTHDDVTMRGIAAAFGAPLVRHPELAAIIARKLGDRATEAAMRMADVPEGCELWDDGMIFPLVVMRNVCIFPGVPSLLKRKYDAVAYRFGGVPVSTARLETAAAESDIADRLTAAAARWPTVAIGSYPHLDHKPYTVTIALDSRDPDALAGCLAELRDALAPDLIPGD